MDSSKSDFQRLFAIGLILSACLVRIAVCLQHNPMDYLFSDMLRHWETEFTSREADTRGQVTRSSIRCTSLRRAVYR